MNISLLQEKLPKFSQLGTFIALNNFLKFFIKNLSNKNLKIKRNLQPK